MKLKDYIAETNKYIEEFNLLTSGNLPDLNRLLQLFDVCDARLLDEVIYREFGLKDDDDEIPESKGKLIIPSFQTETDILF